MTDKIKIAVPSYNGKLIAHEVDRHSSFVVFEIEAGSVTACKRRSRSRQKEHVASDLQDCYAIICHGMNRSQWEIFEEEGIEVIVTGHRKVQKAFRQYLTGLLGERRIKITPVSELRSSLNAVDTSQLLGANSDFTTNQLMETFFNA